MSSTSHAKRYYLSPFSPLQSIMTKLSFIVSFPVFTLALGLFDEDEI